MYKEDDPKSWLTGGEFETRGWIEYNDITQKYRVHVYQWGLANAFSMRKDASWIHTDTKDFNDYHDALSYLLKFYRESKEAQGHADRQKSIDASWRTVKAEVKVPKIEAPKKKRKWWER